MNNITTTTATPKPMTAAQAKAIEAHRADVMKSWMDFGKARVSIRFEKGMNYNGAPAVVRLKHLPTDEGVSEYSLPGVYLDALRFLVQCAGMSPAKARRALGETFEACQRQLPEGRESARRLAKAFVRDCLALAEQYAGTARHNNEAGRKQAKWLLVDGTTIQAPM
jgi:hypothetical protein